MPNENVITNIVVDDDVVPIGTTANNVGWDANITLQDLIGVDINTTTSISNRLLTIETLLNTIEDNALQQETNIQGLIAAAAELRQSIQNLDIDTINYKLTNLENNILNIPIKNIRWDVVPGRNLKQVLGNLDNMPYATLRDWLEVLESKEGGGSSTDAEGVIRWEKIASPMFTELTIKEGKTYTAASGATHDNADYHTVTLEVYSPCLLILRCSFAPNINQNSSESNFTISSTPTLTWSQNNPETYSYTHSDYNSGNETYFYNYNFYTYIADAGTIQIRFDNLPYYTISDNGSESSYNMNFVISAYAYYGEKTTLSFIGSTAFEQNPTSIELPNQKERIYFFESPTSNTFESLNFDIVPTYKSKYYEKWLQTLYFEASDNNITFTCTANTGTVSDNSNPYISNSLHCTTYELQ